VRATLTGGDTGGEDADDQQDLHRDEVTQTEFLAQQATGELTILRRLRHGFKGSIS
jgi:hypothetical protein